MGKDIEKMAFGSGPRDLDVCFSSLTDSQSHRGLRPAAGTTTVPRYHSTHSAIRQTAVRPGRPQPSEVLGFGALSFRPCTALRSAMLYT